MCSIEWSMIHTRYSRRIFCSSEFLLWRNGHHTWPSLRFVLMTRPSLLPSKADQLLQCSLLQVGRIPPSLSFTNRTIWFEQELGGASILNILDGSRVWWLWNVARVQEILGLNPSTVNWMDIFTLICGKKCIVFLKRPKINKRGRGSSKKSECD